MYIYIAESLRCTEAIKTTLKINYTSKNKFLKIIFCCSVSQLCPTLCNPMDCSTPGFSVILSPRTCSNSAESIMPSNHHILCHPLLFLPSIFPSIQVFSNESSLCIRWPYYWNFSFSISLCNEYSGLISFRIDI